MDIGLDKRRSWGQTTAGESCTSPSQDPDRRRLPGNGIGDSVAAEAIGFDSTRSNVEASWPPGFQDAHDASSEQAGRKARSIACSIKERSLLHVQSVEESTQSRPVVTLVCSISERLGT